VTVNGDETGIGEGARLSVTEVILVTFFGDEAPKLVWDASTRIGEGIRQRIAIFIVF